MKATAREKSGGNSSDEYQWSGYVEGKSREDGSRFELQIIFIFMQTNKFCRWRRINLPSPGSIELNISSTVIVVPSIEKCDACLSLTALQLHCAYNHGQLLVLLASINFVRFERKCELFFILI